MASGMAGMKAAFGVGGREGIGLFTALTGSRSEVGKALFHKGGFTGKDFLSSMDDVQKFRQGVGTGLQWAGGIGAVSTALDVFQGEGSIMGTGFGAAAAYGLYRGGRGMGAMSKGMTKGVGRRAHTVPKGKKSVGGRGAGEWMPGVQDQFTGSGVSQWRNEPHWQKILSGNKAAADRQITRLHKAMGRGPSLGSELNAVRNVAGAAGRRMAPYAMAGIKGAGLATAGAGIAAGSMWATS